MAKPKSDSSGITRFGDELAEEAAVAVEFDALAEYLRETKGMDHYVNGQVKFSRAAKGETLADKENRMAEEKRLHALWSGLSAAEKTQLAADTRWGTEGPRYRCHLTHAQGRDKVKIEHPPVTLSATSADEARSRYLEICGITETNLRIVTEAA